MKINLLQYIAGFLGFIALFYGIFSLIREYHFLEIKSLEVFVLIFFGFFAITYAFTDRIMIEKPFALTFAVILFYLSLITPLPLTNKILLITGGIIETQLASRKGVKGTVYIILGILTLIYFVYAHFINLSSILSLIGIGLSSLIIVLGNRDRKVKGISYLTYPVGIPLVVYGINGFFPLSINPIFIIVGLAIVLLNLLPSKGIPSSDYDLKLDQKLCNDIQRSECKDVIQIYKKYMVYIPQHCLDKVVLCTINQNDMQNFNLVINNSLARSVAERYVDKMSPEMLYSLALLSSRKKELLELACKKGYKKACEQTKPILDMKNWDPKVWVGKEIYNYNIVDIIGVGGTSYILKGEKDGNFYALKIPLINYLNNVMDLVGESSKLIELSNKSPYIVRLYAIYADQLDVKEILGGNPEIYYNKPPMLVIELMKGGSINDVINVKELVKSEYWKKIVFITTARIAEALETIHSEGYVHCDVKPQNVLFNEKLPPNARLAYDNLKNGKIIVKLADLGSAVKAGEKPFSYTPAYVSFDLVKSTAFGGVSPMADIYALGATVYKLLTGVTLNTNVMIEAMDKFEANKDIRYLDNSLYSTRNLDLLRKYVDKNTYLFISKMVDPDPNKRPTSKEIKEFFYFRV
ncbi:serine/threonine protein kinase [Saccharolobus solfataricus]|uniref:Serine/threonine protein kinase, putative n=3 Tax=Saccharolobus solfataricus TaxID=2287 RepID=Q97U41_SACS2|nr:protein kinase [Saccharolobus solfataricus]AAK43281.1 Serine/threonine protein kinase, putative [Saccharolobus solfataricus P2]AKA73304.1 serine/threonine protein kinase [Saccharolobus solfataricus]AKA76003.1 serine/threonine protein kinase [Saccharolobus solfataricus]AKA78696.1 serine/threonine protein kinase [Saccharolobus solfataricus]AZF67771.1 serine/threonine protein kinase [Saccharolobus solfataricus]